MSKEKYLMYKIANERHIYDDYLRNGIYSPSDWTTLKPLRNPCKNMTNIDFSLSHRS